MKTPQDFIDFFSAIPEENWRCDGNYGRKDELQHCAVGHLGFRDGKVPQTEETILNLNALNYLFSINNLPLIINVNDLPSEQFPQPTPKQRILAALEYIKENERRKLQNSHQ